MPFTRDEFLQVFEDYNRAIWPAQIVAYVLGIACVILAFSRWSRLSYAALGLFWLWNGMAYHFAFFTKINPAGAVFGSLFVVQALFFIDAAFRPPRVIERTKAGLIIGGAAVIYAMAAYPIIGTALGHAYPASPVFGVAPCPTTIFTLGVLLFLDRRTSL